VDVGGLILLSKGRLDGSSQKEQNEQSGAEHTLAETIHGKILQGTMAQY
jgi:hypothetical protein